MFVYRNPKIFPNPVQDKIYFQVENENSTFQFSLIDLTGRIVCNQEIKAIDTPINLSDVPKGIYLWEVKDELENVGNGKVLIIN